MDVAQTIRLPKIVHILQFSPVPALLISELTVNNEHRNSHLLPRTPLQNPLVLYLHQPPPQAHISLSRRKHFFMEVIEMSKC